MWKWLVLTKPIKRAWSEFINPAVSWRMKLIPIIAILYALSPIDVIPDVFVGLGQLDDVGIILLALKLFMSLAQPRIMPGSVNKSGDEKLASDQRVEEGEFEEI